MTSRRVVGRLGASSCLHSVHWRLNLRPAHHDLDLESRGFKPKAKQQSAASRTRAQSAEGIARKQLRRRFASRHDRLRPRVFEGVGRAFDAIAISCPGSPFRQSLSMNGNAIPARPKCSMLQTLLECIRHSATSRSFSRPTTMARLVGGEMLSDGNGPARCSALSCAPQRRDRRLVRLLPEARRVELRLSVGAEAGH